MNEIQHLQVDSITKVVSFEGLSVDSLADINASVYVDRHLFGVVNGTENGVIAESA